MNKFDDDLRREHLEGAIEKDMGPVVAIFRISSVPGGGAPLQVRESWKGLALPVRENIFKRITSEGAEQSTNVATGEPVEIAEPVPVFGYDAIKALKEADREPAASYWERADMALATLIFQAHEGELLLEPDEGQGNS